MQRSFVHRRPGRYPGLFSSQDAQHELLVDDAPSVPEDKRLVQVRHYRRRGATSGDTDESTDTYRLTGPTFQDAGAPAAEVVTAAELVPAHLLDGGEIVIFAIKPSLWFVAFSSFRTLAAMVAIVLLAAWAGDRVFGVDAVVIVQGALLIGVARLVVGMMQWVSRLYVLTNRRIMRLTGVFHVDIFECPLTRIERTALHGEWYERLTGTGTILFATTPGGAVEVSWNHVDSPAEVHERVCSAIHRAKSPPMR